MTTLIFEDIVETSIPKAGITEEHYGTGKLGEFEVVIMKSNGYINISKIVSQAKTKGGNPKEYGDWHRSKVATALIARLCKLENMTEGELIISRQNSSSNKLRGTYVHELLAVEIAGWASIEFKVKMLKITLDFYKREVAISLIEAKRRDDEAIVLKGENVSLKKKNTTLEEKMEELIRMSHKTHEDSVRTHEKLEKVGKETQRGNKKISNLEKKVDTANKKLDEVKEDNVKTHTDLGESKKDHKETHKKLREVKEDNRKTHEELGDIKEKLVDTEKDHKKTHKELGEIKEELVDVKEEMGDVKEKLGDVKEELGDVKKDNRKTHEELGDIKEKLVDTEKDHKKTHKELGEIKEELGDVKEELGDVKDELVDSKEDAKKLTKKVDTANSKLDKSNTEMKEVKKELGGVKKKVGGLKKDVKGLKEKVIGVEENIEEMREEMYQRVVPPTGDYGVFGVYYLNDPIKGGGGHYKCCSVLISSLDKTFKTLQKEYPKAVFVDKATPHPNARNFKASFRDSFSKGKEAKITMNNCKFKTKSGKRDDKLVKEMIESIRKERRSMLIVLGRVQRHKR